MNANLKRKVLCLLSFALVVMFLCACAAPADPPAGDTTAAPADTSDITAEPSPAGDTTAVPADTADITAEPSPGGEDPSAIPEGCSEIVLAFPDGNYYAPAAERKPLAAELLLPNGWTVRLGGFTGSGYYPNEAFVSLCIPASTGGRTFYSVYNEAGDCVGTISCVGFIWAEDYGDRDAKDPAEAELMAMRIAYSEQTMGSMRWLSLDFSPGSVIVTSSGMLALIGTAGYDTKLEETPQQLSLPAIASFNAVYDFGIFMEFAEGALTEEQLGVIASSIGITEAEG